MRRDLILKRVNTFFREGFGSNFFTSELKDEKVTVFMEGKSLVTMGWNGVDLLLPEENTIAFIWEIMLKDFFGSYEEVIEKRISEILKSPFPYFPYTEEDMFEDWDCLLKSSSPKSNSGRRIINCFHSSTYKANKKDHPSPFEAWSDKDCLKAVIENRLVYAKDLDDFTIVRGFSTSGKAPRVSVFAPTLARYLIEKYLSNYEEIIDPFSGYSGRMLGAASLGKTYRGWDINPETVKESKELLNFMGLENCSVEVKDTVEYKSSGQCLLTCPPYGDLENWNQPIDNYSEEFWVHTCLENYNCQRYLFVVSGNYKSERCVEILSNKNHLNSKSSEKVLLFDKGSF